MKTPEEIKKGMECCTKVGSEGCKECPYDGECLTGNPPEVDALAYIQQLEAGIDHAEKVTRECAKSITENLDKLQSRLAQVERERDAAVRDVQSLCATNYFSGDYCEYCKYREPDVQCFHDCTPYSSEWGWEWRGVCAENTEEGSK